MDMTRYHRTVGILLPRPSGPTAVVLPNVLRLCQAFAAGTDQTRAHPPGWKKNPSKVGIIEIPKANKKWGLGIYGIRG